jgi:hypothetical protein
LPFNNAPNSRQREGKISRAGDALAGTVPTPNQITRMGITATFGMVLNPIDAG